ncbi:protein translocase, SecG subunit [Treponema sp. JC4]|uniref:preprotein translocase subunit SecG n=1 Tax=Treponema sp. JC4 TaxID=1124982 RepID=UPI00025B0C00|nr:preprotein translocase subunit SecG [Treponema sp. JC4]EID85577.1 protein translocase, SecG subunit [Treponema sp. JC4]
MGTLGVVLLVAFVIVCFLLVLLVSIQDDGENGMGGLLGGRGTAAFGAHSASILTKTTFVFVVLFFGLSLGLALINKKPSVAKDLVEPAAVEATADDSAANAEWWKSEASSEEATLSEAE